jgi:hypothetical protein
MTAAEKNSEKIQRLRAALSFLREFARPEEQGSWNVPPKK